MFLWGIKKRLKDNLKTKINSIKEIFQQIYLKNFLFSKYDVK